jgi:hypothetical protein
VAVRSGKTHAALNPRPTRAFVEYSQARGLLLDQARVRSPRDEPHVESGIRYAREHNRRSAFFSLSGLVGTQRNDDNGWQTACAPAGFRLGRTELRRLIPDADQVTADG